MLSSWIFFDLGFLPVRYRPPFFHNGIVKNGYPQDIAFSVLFLWNSYILLKLNSKAVWGCSASPAFEPAGKEHADDAVGGNKICPICLGILDNRSTDTADRCDNKFNACAI